MADGTHSVGIVLYIDEVHGLKVPLGRDSNSEGRTRLDALRSVLNVFSEEPLFYLLISTQLLLNIHDRAS